MMDVDEAQSTSPLKDNKYSLVENPNPTGDLEKSMKVSTSSKAMPKEGPSPHVEMEEEETQIEHTKKR